MKDPETGRRRSRARPEGEMIVTDVPDLRIIAQPLWEQVKQRQETLDRRASSDAGDTPFWSKQRPRYLFSGLMRCGVCGGGFSKISAQHFGCSSARNKGDTVCTNRRAIRCDELENMVLAALRERLMDPTVFKAFVQEFTAEWNRLQGNTAAEQDARASGLTRIRHQIDRLVDALANGTPPAAVNDRLIALEARRIALEAEIATTQAPAPRLHPNLAELYRQRVAELAAALRAEDADHARSVIRGLVEEIRLLPEGDRHRIEVRGELGAILRLSEAANAAETEVQIKMVAGMRNHLDLLLHG